MLPQTVFWICRGLTLVLLCLAAFFGIHGQRKGFYALLYGFAAALVVQFVLLPFFNGYLEGILLSILPEAFWGRGLPLGLLLATAVYEMLAFVLLALPVKGTVSAPLAGCFGIGYWGCSIVWTLVSDLMNLLGSRSILFAGTVLDTLCSGLVPVLNLPLYFALALGAAALVSGGGLRFLFRGILWNLVYRLILALPVLAGVETAMALALAGLWCTLLLIYSIRAGRCIVSLEDGLPEAYAVEMQEEKQGEPEVQQEEPEVREEKQEEPEGEEAERAAEADRGDAAPSEDRELPEDGSGETAHSDE